MTRNNPTSPSRAPSGIRAASTALLLLAAGRVDAQAVDRVEVIAGESADLRHDVVEFLSPPELYSNGPFVNAPGGGPVPGTDASVLQSNSFTPPVVGLGYRNRIDAGERIADDFVVPAPGWDIEALVFHEYQTFSGTWPTFNDFRVRIWDGPPGAAGSTVVFGDLETNRFVSAEFSHIYRVPESALNSLSRPVMRSVVEAVVRLAPGQYWLEWAAAGSIVHTGPYQPPITVNGQCATGDALAYDPTTSSWRPIVDDRNTLDPGDDCPQGLPFAIEGRVTSAIEGPPPGSVEVILTTPVPNPSSRTTVVVAEVLRSQTVRVEVFDVQGRHAALLHDGPASGRLELVVDASALPSGAYVVRAAGERDVARARLIVTR